MIITVFLKLNYIIFSALSYELRSIKFTTYRIQRKLQKIRQKIKEIDTLQTIELLTKKTFKCKEI